MNELDKLLQQTIDRGASDLHLNHNARITMRIDGSIIQDGPYIEGDTIYGLALYALSSEQQRTFNIERRVDFSYAVGKTRFRGNLVYQKGRPSCVLRKINSDVIPIDELGLPSVLKKLANAHQGMILVTGPTGSGKSTSLASVIDYINENKNYHITTIEEPVEYIHVNKKSIVTQQEVGKDVLNFKDGLRSALRRDPDVILVGEMRDEETIGTAMSSSETGHLVFGTLHTNSAPHTINRLLMEFPSSESEKIKGQLSSSLNAVVSQRLFPKPGGGRTACFEIMVVDDEMRDIIRNGYPEKLYDAMKRKPENGNILMQDSIRRAKEQGLIYNNIEW